jgi:hypothetical protein
MCAKQVLYYLSHVSNPFCSVILEMGSHKLFVWNCDPHELSQVARITGYHHCPASLDYNEQRGYELLYISLCAIICLHFSREILRS